MKSSIALLERLEPDLFGGLAMEDQLLDRAEGSCLFLWRGQKGLVLGKNQNPWREANLTVLQERGITLARRVSGGGAVVHDPGNLNLAWVLERNRYRVEEIHAVLRHALASLGLESRTTPAGATTVEERKVSGSAYCYRRERVLHHSTLLVDADLEDLRAALSAPRIRMRSHAVASLPAQVANLTDFDARLDVSTVVKAIKTAATDLGFAWRLFAETECPLSPDRRQRMSDPAWIWGQTPRFQAEIQIDDEVLRFTVAKGQIETLDWKAAEVRSAVGVAFDGGVPTKLADALGLNPDRLRSRFREQGWMWPGT